VKLREGDFAKFVSRDGLLLGAVVLDYAIRRETNKAIETLNRMGIRTFLLTDEGRTVAAHARQEHKIDPVKCELLPEIKLEDVKSLVAQGNEVAIIGDGFNDALARRQASLEIAIRSETDAAREGFNVVLPSADLRKLVEVIKIARRARHTIWRNFACTLLTDLVGIALAAGG